MASRGVVSDLSLVLFVRLRLGPSGSVRITVIYLYFGGPKGILSIGVQYCVIHQFLALETELLIRPITFFYF